ncbi:hypothetical protein [Planctomicrobium sp. SH664]|uniref:hypothetical protein n=1 Tax=Planctomicrobium sp. SH664 TaxID=3448125 RepID=UPI003F5CA202
MCTPVLLGLLSLVGCGKTDVRPEYPVVGEVTFDGSPVSDGRITFRQTTGEERAFSGRIEEGKYSLTAEPGPMSVVITAARPSGKFDRSNDVPVPLGEMYIPAKYNSETTLTAEVAATDKNVFDFKLDK